MTPNETQLSSIHAAGQNAIMEGMAILGFKYLKAAIERWEEIRPQTQIERTNHELGVQLAKAREELAALKCPAAIKPNPTPDEVERAEFEAWAESPTNPHDIELKYCGGGIYYYSATRVVFDAWQAARKGGRP